jgi:hypothetical protein
MADEATVAPEQGTEGADSGADLYNLDSVENPEVRQQLEPHVKAIQSNVEKKFREAADYRKGWQPYEEMGLQDMQPDQLKQLLDFASMANDPTQFDEWLKTAAEERGLLNGVSGDDLDLEDVEEMSPEKIEELVAKQTQPIKEALENQSREQAIAGAEEEVQTSLQGIRKDNPDLPENAEDAIEQLAYRYTDEPNMSASEIIAKGFEDYQNLIGQGEKGLFEQKANQPAPAEGPAAAAMGDEKITSFNDPKLRARVLEKIEKAG